MTFLRFFLKWPVKKRKKSLAKNILINQSKFWVHILRSVNLILSFWSLIHSDQWLWGLSLPVRFFTFFTFFSKSKKHDFLRFFWVASHVFSNTGLNRRYRGVWHWPVLRMLCVRWLARPGAVSRYDVKRWARRRDIWHRVRWRRRHLVLEARLDTAYTLLTRSPRHH